MISRETFILLKSFTSHVSTPVSIEIPPKGPKMRLLNCSKLLARVYFTLALREIEFRFAAIVNSKIFRHESFTINSEKFSFTAWVC